MLDHRRRPRVSICASGILTPSDALDISCSLAYPLFNGFLGGYLQAKNASFGDTSVDATYCEFSTFVASQRVVEFVLCDAAAYTYQAACGVIGSILAAGLVQWNRGGRKFAMAFFTVGAGVSSEHVLFSASGLTQHCPPGLLVWLDCRSQRARDQRLDLHGRLV